MYLKLLTIALVFFALTGCDPGFENINNDEGTSDADSYISPFVWQLEMDDGSFDLTSEAGIDGALLSTTSGDYDELSSGFSRFTVGITTGNSAPAQGAQLPALVLENQLLFMREWDGSDPLKPFIPNGECPQGDFSANWIQLTTPAGQSATSTENAFFGNITFDAGATELIIDNSFALTPGFDAQPTTEPLEVGRCDEGIVQQDNINAFFAENGAALIQQNGDSPQESLWLALPQTPISSDDLSGSYIGFWVDNGRAINDRLWAVTLSCAAFSCPAQQIQDIANLNSITGQGFQIDWDEDALDEPLEGFITGTLTPNNDLNATPTPIACIASDNFNDTGDKLLACVGQSPENPQLTVTGVFVATN